jgi:hypothetical protein
MIRYKQATGKSENTIADYRVTFKKLISALWHWAADEGFVKTNIVRVIQPPAISDAVIETFTREFQLPSSTKQGQDHDGSNGGQHHIVNGPVRARRGTHADGKRDHSKQDSDQHKKMDAHRDGLRPPAPAHQGHEVSNHRKPENRLHDGCRKNSVGDGKNQGTQRDPKTEMQPGGTKIHEDFECNNEAEQQVKRRI